MFFLLFEPPTTKKPQASRDTRGLKGMKKECVHALSTNPVFWGKEMFYRSTSTMQFSKKGRLPPLKTTS
jgi:hypothetical protein